MKKDEKAKFPFQKKSVEELVQEMDKALENTENEREWTEEEERMYDAEYGYFDDDQRNGVEICLKWQNVKPTGDRPPWAFLLSIFPNPFVVFQMMFKILI